MKPRGWDIIILFSAFLGLLLSPIIIAALGFNPFSWALAVTINLIAAKIIQSILDS